MTVYGTTVEEFHAGFSKVCEEYGCSYELINHQNPLYVPKDISLISAIASPIARLPEKKLNFVWMRVQALRRLSQMV